METKIKSTIPFIIVLHTCIPKYNANTKSTKELFCGDNNSSGSRLWWWLHETALDKVA